MSQFLINMPFDKIGTNVKGVLSNKNSFPNENEIITEKVPQ